MPTKTQQQIHSTGVAQGWWRWPLLPFAAVAGALVGSVLASLLMWFGMKLQGGYTEDGWYFRYVMPVISSAIFGYLYAHISCEMAPCGKIIAGTVMVTTLGLFGLLISVLAWTIPDYPIGEAIQVTVGTVATMIAAVLTLIDASNKVTHRT
jgi:uncharacterized membrane protein YvlD (DUF360 family)